MKQLPKHVARAVLVALAALASAAGAAPAASPQAAPAAPALAPEVFARVGATVISHHAYGAAFNEAARAKFYHGKPPEAEIARLQRDVADQMVARVVLLDEVRRRGLRPIDADLQKTVQQYEQRYANSAQWQANKDKMLPPLLARLGEDSQLAQLEQSVRAAALPDEAAVKAYYDANPVKFTEPVRNRVAMILLKVEPSAPDAAWEEAGLKAEGLVRRMQAGEAFDAIARAYSNDASAASGGDLGYQHGGMLSSVADAVLAKLEVGQTSDPERVLEGIAVFRLLDRIAPKLQPFDAVKERARELARRVQSDQAWNGFVAALVAKVDAQVDRSRFLPLEGQARAPILK